MSDQKAPPQPQPPAAVQPTPPASAPQAQPPSQPQLAATAQPTASQVAPAAPSQPQQQPEGDKEKLSLLDVVLQKRAEFSDQKRKGGRHARLVYIGKVPSGPKGEQIGQMHSDYVEQCRQRTQHQTAISGVLLVINKTMLIHLIEGPNRMLLDLLRHLQTNKWLTDMFVLSFTEEVFAEFPFWDYRNVTMPKPEHEDYHNSKVVTLVAGTVKNLLEMGKELSEQNETQARELFHSTKGKLIARIPDCEQLVYFTRQQDVFPLDHFLELFDTPIHFVFESENIWPVEQPLKY